MIKFIHDTMKRLKHYGKMWRCIMDRNEIRDYILDVAEVKQTLLDTTSYCNRIQDAVRHITT